jgi:hypothetical protein
MFHCPLHRVSDLPVPSEPTIFLTPITDIHQHPPSGGKHNNTTTLSSVSNRFGIIVLFKPCVIPDRSNAIGLSATRGFSVNSIISITPSFNPNTDASGRFQVPAGTASFAFAPGSATNNFSTSATTTATAGQSAKSTYTVSFAVSGQASASFVADVSDNFSVSDKVTYTNQASQTITSATSQSMSYSIVPPAIGTYNGATQLQVWQDNIYGTFMFFPEN